MFQSPTMQQPKIQVQTLDLATLFNQMSQGNLQIPRFQRDFVWPVGKTQALLDSMFKEFPIGTFFFWQAPKEYGSLFRELKELNIPHPPQGFPVSYILDGQQRLTSLYVTLTGMQIKSNDYGRICIDLKQATLFEENQDEGFDEPIFVTHTPDNRRYVAFKDLVGSESAKLSKNIPDEWYDAFIDTGNRFRTYPFSVVWVREQPLGEVVEVFQRINQGGKRLSRYDLVAANVWTPAFDFRRRVDSFNKSLAQQGFGEIDPTIMTQSFALILQDKCTTATELKLETKDVESTWDKVTSSVLTAIEFAAANFGVKRADYLPYRGILVVLAYYFHHAESGAISAEHRRVLWQWFWQVSLSERYSSTSPRKMAEDAEKLRKLLNGEKIEFNFRAQVLPEAVARVRMTSITSALRNSILCLLALSQPKNLKDGSPVNVNHSFFATVTQAERHHFFPVDYLNKKGISSSSVHLVANFGFIPADLNQKILEQSPAQYLSEFKKNNPQFQQAATSHLLPVDKQSPIWQNDFNAFIQRRAEVIAERLNQLLEHDPLNLTLDFPTEESEDAKTVRLIENQIRELLHERLTAYAGGSYWDTIIHDGLRMKALGRIQETLSDHPYMTLADFPPGLKYWQECDVSDYINVIKNNWSLFQDIFGPQTNAFAQHMENFRIFRNSTAHNNPPNPVERRLAEAAVIWIQQCLDKYVIELEIANRED